jgi:putative redox protein
MAGIKTARAHFDGGMRFTAQAGSGHQVIMDTADEKEGGQNSGFSPMELPLVALIGCVGMDVVSILRKQRQEVTGYDLTVSGTRAETHPQVFVAITVEHTITGRDLKRAAVERALELSRTKYCSVSAMLGKTAEITHILRVVEAQAE